MNILAILVNPLVLALAALVIDAALIVALVLLVRRQKKLRRLLGGLAALHRTVDNPELIEEWKRKRADLPVGCPKWRAYTKRLIEKGELPSDALGH